MDRLPSLPASEAQAQAIAFAQTLIDGLNHLNVTEDASDISLTPEQEVCLAQLPRPSDRRHTFEALFLVHLAKHYVIVSDARAIP
jgi:hypothetical protein